jgi:hypothetical protein
MTENSSIKRQTDNNHSLSTSEKTNEKRAPKNGAVYEERQGPQATVRANEKDLVTIRTLRNESSSCVRYP